MDTFDVALIKEKAVELAIRYLESNRSDGLQRTSPEELIELAKKFEAYLVA